MLTPVKQSKLLDALKKYSKKYLNSGITELDESGTRLMINAFLTEVLGYAPIEEVKTEYMIKGTYADYVIQLQGTRHFLVEVKALSLNLAPAHLRQAVNYGANEGIYYALLTNGRLFEFYRIIVDGTVESRKIFAFDFTDATQLKNQIEVLQFLHKDAVAKKGLDFLWNKCAALEAANVAGVLYTEPVMNLIKKSLKERFNHKFTDEEIKAALNTVVSTAIPLDQVKHVKTKAKKKVDKPSAKVQGEVPVISVPTAITATEGMAEVKPEELN